MREVEGNGVFSQLSLEVNQTFAHFHLSILVDDSSLKGCSRVSSISPKHLWHLMVRNLAPAVHSSSALRRFQVIKKFNK